MNNLNWIGLAVWIASAACFGIIGFRRSAWWGPARSVFEELDPKEKRLAKIGGLFSLAGSVFFLVSAIY